MLYAKIVFGIPVEGPFDYLVPQKFQKKIKAGARAWVDFGNRKKLGYVVAFAKKSSIKKIKEISEVIDDFPVLDKNMLLLTRKLSRYYCCSYGEAIETALPQFLRKGRSIPRFELLETSSTQVSQQGFLIHDLEGCSRWDIYLDEIQQALSANKSVIFLLPDRQSLLKAKKIIQSKLNSSIGVLYRNSPGEKEEWLKIRSGKVNLVIGTRSAIFAPLKTIGLIIIDEEHDQVYKQDQVPHYHAREAAFLRADIEKAKFVLGTVSPTLESLYLVRQNKIGYRLVPRIRKFPEVKIIDMKSEYNRARQKKAILSKYLEDSIALSLNSGGKVVLFLNRKGYATFVSCHNCGKVLRCPRCNINLVYHFKENSLNCTYCAFKMEPPKICPSCNAGYIKFSGLGTEKIESELSRIFVQARIKRFNSAEKTDFSEADIFIATSAIIRNATYNFSLIGVLGIDNSLNRVDFRSSEKAFSLVSGLLTLSEEKIVIQTTFPEHHMFKAILKKDIESFYKEELKQRKSLGFPPYNHLIIIKLRAPKEEKARESAASLFQRLSREGKRGIRIISVNPAQPAKLRGNFYWQILISSHDAEKASRFLKIHLKNFLHSGIIVTVDVDPL